MKLSLAFATLLVAPGAAVSLRAAPGLKAAVQGKLRGSPHGQTPAVGYDGSPDSDPDANNWFITSDNACSSAGEDNVTKCPDTASWTCKLTDDDLSVNLYCDDDTKESCGDTLAAMSADAPNGAGWMNPRLMLGTDDMVAAAAADGYDGTYGVVTIDALRCGQCVEVTPNDPDGNFPLAVKLKAQIFNSVAASIDVYMAGGGLGTYNGCAPITGYSPSKPFYTTYPNQENADFISYLTSIGYFEQDGTSLANVDSNVAQSGGIRGGKTYGECRAKGSPDDPMDACTPEGNGCSAGAGMCLEGKDICSKLFVGVGDASTNYALQSCEWVYDHDMHWNRDVTVKVVACPESLTELTGLRPEDPEEQTNWEFTVGDDCTSQSCYGTTTMEDCSLPTCARISNTKGDATSQNNGKEYTDAYNTWQDGYAALIGANLVGEPYTASIDPVDDPCPKPLPFAGATFSPTAPTPAPTCAALYTQCGGQDYTGYTDCCEGDCVETDEYYSQCQ